MNEFDAYIHRRMKPRSLQLLVAVDDLRQVSKVASLMNVTQAAVSKAISEMERALGLRLFDRGPRGVHPTVYGECLIRHSRIILGGLGQARDELRSLVSGSPGMLRVGALTTAAIELLPRALVELKTRHPSMTFIVREGTNEALLPQLWCGDLDLIVGLLPDRRFAGPVKEKVLKEVGVSVVASPKHVLVKRRRIRWADVVGFPWVLPPLNTLPRAPLERTFEQHGIPLPANRIETLSVHVIRSYLHHSDALAVISEEVAKYYEALGLVAILPLELPRLAGPIGVVWSQHRPLSPGAEELIGCLEHAVGPHDAVGRPRVRRARGVRSR